MRILPYELLKLHTREPPEAVAARLEKMIASGWFFLKNPPQPFRGRISGRHFKVVRLLGTFLGLRYHNSWQPVIIGDIAPVAEGTEVRVKMRPHAFVAVFTAVWFGGLFAFLATAIGIARRRGFESAAAGILVACGMGLFGYSIMSFAFWSEVRRAKALLREGLKCAEVGGSNRLVR